MDQQTTFHILKHGANRQEMVAQIREQLNGDEDQVLIQGWENLPFDQLAELYRTTREYLNAE